MKRRALLAALLASPLAHALSRLDGKSLSGPLNLVFEGDSLSDGSGLPPNGCQLTNTCPDAWPNQLLASLTGDITHSSFASDQATLRDVIYPRQALIDAAFDPSRKNVLFIWAGTNDLALLGLYGRDVYNILLQPYIRDRQARGWTVIPFTTLPRQNPPTLPTYFEAEREALNALIHANRYPLLVDVCSDDRIGSINSPLDTNYYFDKTHLTPAGYSIVRDLATLQLLAA